MEDTISEAKRSLPPRFRFHATDEELLLLYLKPKIFRQPGHLYYDIIPEIDLCEFEPWQLPDMFDHMFNRRELFFYCRVKRNHLNSRRSNRTTRAGFWKVTGKARAIMREDTNEQIGIKKTLVFYEGRVANVKRTNWIMYEYHLNSEHLGDNHDKGEMLPYVVCRIKNKKENTPMMRHAPTINPEGHSSSPCTCNSNVLEPPGNQEGDLSSFCSTPKMLVRELMESLTLDDRELDYNNAPNYQPQAAVFAQPEMSLKELMISLPPLDAPNDYVSNYISSPTYRPQARKDCRSLSSSLAGTMSEDLLYDNV